MHQTPAIGKYPALQTITRPMLTTSEAAHYLNRAQQTLRVWASAETGPIRPRRIHGRLAWPTDEIRALLGVAE